MNPTSIRLDTKTYKKVKSDADKAERSISKQIEYIIKRYYRLTNENNMLKDLLSDFNVDFKGFSFGGFSFGVSVDKNLNQDKQEKIKCKYPDYIFDILETDFFDEDDNTIILTINNYSPDEVFNKVIESGELSDDPEAIKKLFKDIYGVETDSNNK